MCLNIHHRVTKQSFNILFAATAQPVAVSLRPQRAMVFVIQGWHTTQQLLVCNILHYLIYRIVNSFELISEILLGL